ncbi:rho GTPase-activating protein 27 isoform X1 [Oryzias melastigma]|uniref:rho GTPase-activating protein 27 isoform X1 n=1 Tax=Oryzias melastigma TaxID=30732 RepID=UPI00168D5CB5|nr:rho GTPase-activating protein 27 isoform X1 [Oryzias melastigma]
MELVSVEYEYQYKAKDGHIISIKPQEVYILVCKTNEHWWRVRKDQDTKPFYIPASYVKELSAPPTKSTPTKNSSESDTKSKPLICTSQAPSKEKYRFSTFGFCENSSHVNSWEPVKGTASRSVSLADTPNTAQMHNSKPEAALISAPAKADSLDEEPKPQPAENPARLKEPQDDAPKEQMQTFPEDYNMDFPLPPPDMHDMIPDIEITESDNFPEPETLVPAKEESTGLQSSNQTTETAPLTVSKVQDDNVRTGVYVNVAQLRQSISESPPSVASPCSPSPFNEWEVHVDQDSGQEYYYHTATGRTTWESPFLDSPTDTQQLPSEEPRPPSLPRSPLSLSSPLPSGWTSDWEQLVDESSGRPYFYNAMSGETSWEPPEQQSPYPPLMDSLNRFPGDGLPPLPVEDYPPEDYPTDDIPDVSEDHLATQSPSFSNEFSFSHVTRTNIPRANLDRSTPPGWNLTVEPNGTWVFTNDNSPDQWIKSVDEQGQTYYYLRDGSRSQWNLPEAPVAPYQSRENGVEGENVSVIRNWRHTMGPSQFTGQDDGRFVQTHKRNMSDNSSNGASTENSSETQHNVQNLEKAGILNKTKVCENGKKVRKNWTATWTVLREGVLTFHKDPKSTTAGNINKTNQIVPEFAVELKGATIGWASKDKSSKKNVLELKGKNGVEFLIQYDTDSIIHDWHKIILDAIRKLDYQDQHPEEEDGDIYEKIAEDKPSSTIDRRKQSKPAVTNSPSSSGETDPKKVRTKLMKLLMKRPTLEAVKEKGYFRENVFGCPLDTLCAHEKTTVPSFVEKCIKAVEKRGLDIDGLYRVSGNLAVIQKLRFKADHEELNLEDGQWEDVHVITGALKLFFRELPEPLFPYSHFEAFISAIRIPDYNTKLLRIYELVRSLPQANHDTMALLFEHLHRLIQYGEDNRMTVQNVAIVFGPTLLRPEKESSNIAMHMIFQNQIVEFILNEYERIFCSS